MLMMIILEFGLNAQASCLGGESSARETCCASCTGHSLMSAPFNEHSVENIPVTDLDEKPGRKR